MSKLKYLLIIEFAVIALLVGKSLFQSEEYHGYVPDPVQVDLAVPGTITVAGGDGDVGVSLMAEYTIEGVVKSKEAYSDYTSAISKYDVAMAWGELNQEEADEEIHYSQSGRWYYYRYSEDCPVTMDYIASHSANVHLIHKDKEILKKIKRIRKEDYVRFEGYLVKVNYENGPWESSLSRTDTGDGACEVLYVTSVEIFDKKDYPLLQSKTEIKPE